MLFKDLKLVEKLIFAKQNSNNIYEPSTRKYIKIAPQNFSQNLMKSYEVSENCSASKLFT